MDAGVDSMTEANIVSELVQLAIDRELAGVRAGIGIEREAIVRRHHRIWDHEVAIEEKLQNSNASAANHSVPRRIGRVRRRAFGKCLRKQPSLILVEALLKSLRVQDDVAQFGRGVRALPGLDQVDESTGVLWTRTQVNLPFLVPHGLQGAS